ncbi:MAG: hypothetical protein R3240_07465 [Gammaproteobacteria bacterium]|nr:hypothetical protein [Gammaproteobacteria bacterium]
MRLLNDYWFNVERYNPDIIQSLRPLRCSEPETFPFYTADNVKLLLTRYQGGSKGPVLLSHCIGVSSYMYSLTSIETNLLEYLYEREYDVWLLDHRLSILLEASTHQSSMDDVAINDYPAAVNKVCEISGSPTVQIVAHGVGASTLTMSLLSGLNNVRTAVCSQVSTHLDALPINSFKAKLHLPQLLSAMGKTSMTCYSDINASLATKLFDASLIAHPVAKDEHCNSTVCHRVTALFGELYEHSQLNRETHRILGALFGRVNLTAMTQLTQMLIKGSLVDKALDDVYLPNAKVLKLPMTFISGGNNVCVLPTSTQKTIEFLNDVNGAEYYRRFEIAGYGHVDCIIGKNAAKEIYPFILEGLAPGAAREQSELKQKIS